MYSYQCPLSTTHPPAPFSRKLFSQNFLWRNFFRAPVVGFFCRSRHGGVAGHGAPTSQDKATPVSAGPNHVLGSGPHGLRVQNSPGRCRSESSLSYARMACLHGINPSSIMDLTGWAPTGSFGMGLFIPSSDGGTGAYAMASGLKACRLTKNEGPRLVGIAHRNENPRSETYRTGPGAQNQVCRNKFVGRRGWGKQTLTETLFHPDSSLT